MAAGKSFGDGFRCVLTSLLGGYGLIVVDPLDAALKQLCSPTMLKPYFGAGRSSPPSPLEARS